MQVFYRKFRPQTFEDVVGQHHVVQTLRNQVKNNQSAHAYLFTGPRGVGKTSVARILARAINCAKSKNGEPDNTCDICLDMINGRSLDLSEIDAASHTGVDNIREIIEHLPIAPTKAKFRVFIIDEVHMLSKGAFNALLKTLEEPPAHAIFILATTEVHKVPATVISRTQSFDFKRLNEEQTLGHIRDIAKKEKLNLPDEVLRSIAGAAEGGLRDALVLLEKAHHLSEAKISAEELEKLLGLTPLKYREDLLKLLRNSDTAGAVNLIESLSEQGFSIEQFCKEFLEYLRQEIIKNSDALLVRISENFLDAYAKLRLSPIPQLPLMVAAIKSVENPGEGTVKSSNGVQQYQKTSNSHDSGGHTSELQMSSVQDKWMDVLSRVKQYNQSLLTALKLAEPVGTVNGSITISFPYKFHAETVSAAKNRLVIERALEEVFGKKMSVRCVANSDMVNGSASREVRPMEVRKTEANPDLLKSALDVLGGELAD